jgi:uncharacterized protein (TIGR02145 family)
LVSILDLGTTSPAINSVFSGTDSSYYWSSTTYASNTSFAWYVDFYYGYVNGNYKSDNSYVRCVRGGQ